jgi:hypothetical protein
MSFHLEMTPKKKSSRRSKQEKFQPPVDNHNITGQFDPSVHSLTGMVPISISGFQHPAIDAITLEVTKELGGEFKYNLDLNSGKPLGVGRCSSLIIK